MPAKSCKNSKDFVNIPRRNYWSNEKVTQSKKKLLYKISTTRTLQRQIDLYTCHSSFQDPNRATSIPCKRCFSSIWIEVSPAAYILTPLTHSPICRLLLIMHQTLRTHTKHKDHARFTFLGSWDAPPVCPSVTPRSSSHSLIPSHGRTQQSQCIALYCIAYLDPSLAANKEPFRKEPSRRDQYTIVIRFSLDSLL
jgi:hypothetical protein